MVAYHPRGLRWSRSVRRTAHIRTHTHTHATTCRIAHARNIDVHDGSTIRFSQDFLRVAISAVFRSHWSTTLLISFCQRGRQDPAIAADAFQRAKCSSHRVRRVRHAIGQVFEAATKDVQSIRCCPIRQMSAFGLAPIMLGGGEG